MIKRFKIKQKKKEVFLMEEKKTFAPLLPYNTVIAENFSMYYKMPYCCDRDLCHPNIIMSTGNIIKYYSYNLEEEPTKIVTDLLT